MGGVDMIGDGTFGGDVPDRFVEIGLSVRSTETLVALSEVLPSLPEVLSMASKFSYHS